MEPQDLEMPDFTEYNPEVSTLLTVWISGHLDNTTHLIFWLCNTKQLNFRHFKTNRKKFTIIVNFFLKQTKTAPKDQFILFSVSRSVQPISDNLRLCHKISEDCRRFRILPKISEDFRGEIRKFSTLFRRYIHMIKSDPASMPFESRIPPRFCKGWIELQEHRREILSTSPSTLAKGSRFNSGVYKSYNRLVAFFVVDLQRECMINYRQCLTLRNNSFRKKVVCYVYLVYD